MPICIEDGCETTAIFGISKKEGAKYCKKHKKPEMDDVVNKKCLECNKIPLYNFKGIKGGLYCNTHKKHNMVNVIHRICKADNCITQASYNVKGKYAEYCEEHKTDQMERVIFSKSCEHKGCIVRPLYNYSDQKCAKYCAEHKLDNMVIMINTCTENNCYVSASYNYDGKKKPLYCVTHKKEDMVDIKSKRCKTHMCLTRASKKYEGYCLFCFIHTFPEKPITINYKTKESAVVQFVLKEFPDFTWTADKKIQDGCSKRRPDLLVDLGYQIVIVEIDEDQHKDYDCSCENKRIMEISKDLGHRPIVFIRFNPDKYITNGTTIHSCWGLNSKGLCSIKKNKENEWKKRLETLKTQINYWIDTENKTSKLIETVHLFY
jgi:hypothetical protein